MDNILDIKDILINGDKDDFLELEIYLHEKFHDNLEYLFDSFREVLNSYEYDQNEILSFFKNMNALLNKETDVCRVKAIVKQYEKTIYIGNCGKFEKTILKALNKFKLKKENLMNFNTYEALKYIVFEFKDIDLIRKMVMNEHSFMYKKECSHLLYDVINYYLNNTGDEEYIEELIKILLIHGDKFINNDIRSKIGDLFKIHKRNNKIKKISQEFYNMSEFYNVNILSDEDFIYKLNSDGRVDFTSQYVVTIDDFDACCLDDGVCLEENVDGTYTLYIHITDIYDVIKNNKYIDEAAFNLGETIYLRDSIIPMFPEFVCNDIGSLLHNEKRNTITYIYKLDSNFNFCGDKIDDYFSVVKGVVINKARLSYHSVDDILIHGCGNNSLVNMLKKLGFLADKLRKENKQIEKYHLQQNKKMVAMGINQPLESKLLDVYTGANIVQEMMILTNRMLPELFSSRDLPFLYRVCKNATNEEAELYLKKIDDFLINNNISRKLVDYKTLLYYVRENLSDSYYSSNNIGHCGLGLKFYSHSTSPARRYADVVSEKLVYELLFKEKVDLNSAESCNKYIEWVAGEINKKNKNNENYVVNYNKLLKIKNKPL